MAKALIKDEDVLSVVHVKSDKDYLQDSYKSTEIKNRYDAEMTGFLPKERRKTAIVEKTDSTKTKKAVAAWVSDCMSPAGPGDAPKHPMPNFLCLGFSGRKAAGEGPETLGSTADMSLREVPCPCVVVK